MFQTSAEMLTFICTARNIRFFGGETKMHIYKRIFYCFKCRLASVLLSVLHSRGHLEVNDVVKKRTTHTALKYYHIFKYKYAEKLFYIPKTKL